MEMVVIECHKWRGGEARGDKVKNWKGEGWKGGKEERESETDKAAVH